MGLVPWRLLGRARACRSPRLRFQHQERLQVAQEIYSKGLLAHREEWQCGCEKSRLPFPQIDRRRTWRPPRHAEKQVSIDESLSI